MRADRRVRDVRAVVAGLHDNVAGGEDGSVVVHEHGQLLLLGHGQVRALPSVVHKQVGEVLRDRDGVVGVRDRQVRELKGRLLRVPLHGCA